MYGEGFCLHCWKETTFEKVDTNRFYPRYLYCDGYCTECHNLRCNVEIRDLRYTKDKVEKGGDG